MRALVASVLLAASVWPERVDGIFTASPVGADGKIYLVSETGDTIVLQAGRAPKVLARNSVGERTVARRRYPAARSSSARR